ncbi:MAG TPA: hypothetical protein PK779_07515 [Niabella sp.]|nr:hypothetical protein [Niabella sp.]HRB51523.1 hypothetical protein [Niabella sp.]HRC05898.1 hypothetical protein [Niabella sp.]
MQLEIEKTPTSQTFFRRIAYIKGRATALSATARKLGVNIIDNDYSKNGLQTTHRISFP